MNDILDKLHAVLIERKNSNPDSSYVAGLYAKGLDQILKKIGEEAAELIIATKGQDKSEIIYEMADLWFHSMILLADSNIDYNEVLQELERRFGTSGIEEKNSRNK